ncbi:MAG: IS1380 family transposase [Rubrivivax sp.]|nr:IS1380 family transposase [Rubrivivax sp.]
MRTIEVKQLKYDLTPVAGLALVGHHLKTLAPALAKLDAALPVRNGVSHADIVRSYVGLLVQGKSDFDAIENHRLDKFYKQALGITLLPSSPTLRQRMDAQAGALSQHVLPMIETLLTRRAPDYGLLPCGWLAVDIDTFAMDNGGTAKEGVGRTYAGVDGYCPLASYIGSHGFCLELSLRPGTQHSAKNTEDNLKRVIPLAQRLSAAGPKAPLLARLDSGFDSAALMGCLESMNGRADQPGLPQVDWVIKWNPRSTDRAEMAAQIDVASRAPGAVRWARPRAGKRVALWEQAVTVAGVARPVRRVLRLVERTISAGGQHLIVPEYELDGWTTTLPSSMGPEQIIALYADHGTHEQFHAEFKTDLDLTRLPSGKFDTNALVCELAALAMNILRLMGQSGLLGADAPVRHPAKRRRIKTVMQELIYRAGRLIEHGRRLVLGLGANDRAAAVFQRMHVQLAAAP